jgi:hypothetical protein
MLEPAKATHKGVIIDIEYSVMPILQIVLQNLKYHAHKGFNVYRHIPCIVSNLPKPGILHIMLLGMLNYLLRWIFHFMKVYKRLDKYNGIWLSVPAYHGLIPKRKSYEEISQWSAKEIKETCRFLLGVVTQLFR